MSRIRNVKPSYFQHADIFDAEKESGLPLRIAYIGLWTQADRRGHFRWKPRELKLNILPFDDVDFGAVLDALSKRGFVEKWQHDGYWFGTVPALPKHQVFNVREVKNPMIPDRPPVGAMSVPVPCQNSTDTAPVLVGMDAGRLTLDVGHRECEGAKAPPAPVDRRDHPLLEAWNRCSGPANLPVARTLSKSRRRFADARLKEATAAEWESAYRLICSDPFCRGENDRGWKADIDYALSGKSTKWLDRAKAGESPGSNGAAIKPDTPERRAWAAEKLMCAPDGLSYDAATGRYERLS